MYNVDQLRGDGLLQDIAAKKEIAHILKVGHVWSYWPWLCPSLMSPGWPPTTLLSQQGTVLTTVVPISDVSKVTPYHSAVTAGDSADHGCDHLWCLQGDPLPLCCHNKEQCSVGCLLACLASQQHASVSQGRICSDTRTCCHTEIEVADQTFYLAQSQLWQRHVLGRVTNGVPMLTLLVWLDPEKYPQRKQESNTAASALKEDALTTRPILQSCPTFDDLRCQTWPSAVEAHRKLWGPVETLRQTADFALLTGLKI